MKVSSAALTAVVALAAAAAPVAFDAGRLLPTGQHAVAGNHDGGGRGDRGDRGARGGGRGDEARERGRGDDARERGRGDDAGPAGGRGRAAALDGQARGRDAAAVALDRARERYGRALGTARAADRNGAPDGFEREIGKVVAALDGAATRALIARGWTAPDPADDGFTNHGERVRTYVALAKALGHSASVGALQANFGAPSVAATPDETVAALERAIAEAAAALDALDPEAPERADAQAELQALRTALEAASAAPTARRGPAPGAWSTADLDVDDDGRVTRTDLALALAGGPASP